MYQNVFNLVWLFSALEDSCILLCCSNRIIEFNCLCWKRNDIHTANDDKIELLQPEGFLRNIFHILFPTMCGLV